MKTSNILLSIIAGSATFVILAGAIHLRATGVKRSESKSSAQVVNQPLAPFRYLVVREAINLSVRTTDKFQIVTLSGKNDPAPIVEFTQRGDTLIINRIAHGSEGRLLEVTLETAPGSIQYINAKNSMLGLVDYTTDKLVVDLDDAYFTVSGENNQNLQYQSLRFNASASSSIYAQEVTIDTAYLQLDASQAHFGDIKKLSAKLQNSSTVGAGNALDVSYQKDSSSEVY